MEFSLRVENGSGHLWSVDIMKSGQNGGWETIGDLSQAVKGRGWTTASLCITDGDLADYLDPGCGGDILIRVYTIHTWQVRPYLAL